MIKIDGKTSVLYDNAKYAQVTKIQATTTGAADLSSGISIKKDVNDTLDITIGNPPTDYSIKLLDILETEKLYTIDELVDKINSRFTDLGIEGIASKTTSAKGTHIRISDKFFGAESLLNIKSSSNSYQNLFVRYEDTYHTVNPIDGGETVAKVTGNYTIEDSTNIIEGHNDILNITVDGITKNVKIDAGIYTKTDLLSKLNEEFANEGLNITAEYSGLTSSAREQLVLKHNNSGIGSLSLSTNINTSTAFRTLFVRTEYITPSIINGTTTYIPPPEGIVAPPSEVKKPAVILGHADLTEGMIITNDNNILNLNMNGNDISIVLDNGNYTASSFLSMISTKVDAQGMIASYSSHSTYGLNLSITSKQQGAGNYFNNLNGSAYNDILVGKQYYLPSTTSSTATTTKSYIEGLTTITSPILIDDTNNEMNFKYNHNGSILDINIVLDNGNYNNLTDLLAQLNTKLSEQLGVLDGDISFSSNYSRIRMTSTNSGANYTFSDFNGDFYDKYIRRTTSIYNPTVYQGYSNLSVFHTAFIVGREGMQKDITINPGINDNLVFDFYKNSVKETFEIKISAGLYSGSSIVNEMQNKLNIELVAKGYPQDSLKVQIGGVNSGTTQDDTDKLVIKYDVLNDGTNNSGNYIIDGVRGNAAYTLFYQSYGEPKPSYTVGVKDISSGVSIISGKNDVFSFKENNTQINLTLDEGDYSIDELITHLNSKLISASSEVVASAYEGKLKLSFNDVGANTIDAITGNARGELFFEIENREEDTYNNYQIGPYMNDSLTIDKFRISTELMRINTVIISNRNASNKALKRIDKAIEYNSSIRSKIGANQNRIESIIRNNENYSENLQFAESRIRDIDMAKEIMEIAKTNLLKEAANKSLIVSKENIKNILSLLNNI